MKIKYLYMLEYRFVLQDVITAHSQLIPLKQFGHLRMEYVQKLIEEVKGMAKILKDTNKEIETLYIGGGTPTALEKEELDILITALYKELDLSKIKEFTVEAGRPDSITRGKLEVLKKHNVSRISINPQTMNDEHLEKIGRAHSVRDIVVVSHG